MNIQIGTFIFHKKFPTKCVPVNFLDETRFSTSIYHLGTPLWRYNTRKYSLGELILKEFTVTVDAELVENNYHDNKILVVKCVCYLL